MQSQKRWWPDRAIVMLALTSGLLALRLARAAIQTDSLPCATIQSDAGRAACDANDRPGKRERHMARMSQCTFAADPGIDLQYAAQGTGPHQLRPIQNASIVKETCTVYEGLGAWHFTRVGPFSTTGGGSWTSFATVHDESVYPLWHVTHDGRAWLDVSDHVVGSVDGDGDLIGYPPIHQHHWHYSHGSNTWSDRLSVHGDQECLGGQGVYCLLVEYPNTSAFELVPQFNMVAEFNDVRPAGTAPMEWYALGGIFIHDPAKSQPERMSWANAMVVPSNLPLGPRGTSLYDSASEGVAWTTGTIPSMSHVVDSYFHGHPDMVDDLWFIRASPAELGLLTPPWIFAYQTFLDSPSAIKELKAQLEQAISSSPGAELICRYSARPHVELVDGTRTTRRASCLFESDVNDDLQWTFVGFFKAQMGGLPQEYPMHAALRIAYHANAVRWDSHSRVDCLGMDRLDLVNHDTALPGFEESLCLLNAAMIGAGLYPQGILTWYFARDVIYPMTLKTLWSVPLAFVVAILVLCSCTFLCCTRTRVVRDGVLPHPHKHLRSAML